MKNKEKNKKKKTFVKTELDFNKERNLTPYKEILKIKKNKRINLEFIMDNKRKELLNMIKNGIGFPENNVIKPNSLLKFEKELKQSLISKERNFNFLNNIPILKKALFKERKDSIDLEEKIDVGSLLYYNLKTDDNTIENKTNTLKLRYLESSTNFKVNNVNNVFETEFQKIKLKQKNSNSSVFKLFNHKSNKEKIFERNNLINHIKSNSYNINNTDNNIKSLLNLSDNKSRNSNLFQLISKKSIKIPLLKFNNIKTHSKVNSDNTKEILSSSTNKSQKSRRSKIFEEVLSQKISIKHRKNLKNIILNKVRELNNSTNKCNERLFRIVDSSKIPEKDFQNYMTMDMEELLEFKRKKLDGENTKNLVYKVKKNNEYHGMDDEKAEILAISDRVNRLPDDVALYFVDNITKNYKKKNDFVDEVTKKFSPILANYKSKENQILREKLENNYFNIERKGAKLDFKREKLQNLYNKIFNDKIEVKNSGKEFNRNKNHDNLFYFTDYDNDNNINDNENENNDFKKMTDEINLFLNKFENSIKNIEDEIKKNQKTNEEILTTIEDCQKEIQDSISTPQ